MAQSHHDQMHQPGVMDQLFKKAKEMSQNKENVITAGKPGEEVLYIYEEEGLMICQLPDDPLCLRISIGQANLKTKDSYLVFRGDPKQIKLLLTRMLNVFRTLPL